MPGDRISNEVSLAAGPRPLPTDDAQAIQVLVDKGLLVRKRGVGTQVVHGKVHRPLEMTSLFDDLAKAGQKQRTDVLAWRSSPSPRRWPPSSGSPTGDDVWFIERLRFVAGEPLAHMQNYLPAGLVDLEGADLTNRGLYQTCATPASSCASPGSGSAPAAPRTPRPGCWASARALRC